MSGEKELRVVRGSSTLYTTVQQHKIAEDTCATLMGTAKGKISDPGSQGVRTPAVEWTRTITQRTDVSYFICETVV